LTAKDNSEKIHSATGGYEEVEEGSGVKLAKMKKENMSRGLELCVNHRKGS